MKAIKTLALVVNKNKPDAQALAQSLQEEAERCGTSVQATHEYPVPGSFLKGADACCVIGGDGTLLSIVEESVTHQVPVFGINDGKLGFLATFSVEEAREQLSKLLQGDYKLVHRPVLKCQFADSSSRLALNDCVVKHSSASRLIQLKVYSNGQFVNEYYGDGLILSTPTGSTAYNLSAGGPIVHPDAHVIVLTPICPHTLSNRSITFPHDVLLEILCEEPSKEDALISVDGGLCQSSTLPLTIKLAKQSLPLLKPLDYAYFNVLRSKLKWSGSNTRL